MLTIHHANEPGTVLARLMVEAGTVPEAIRLAETHATASLIATYEFWEREDADVAPLREALAVGLVQLVHFFPPDVDMQTGDSTGLVAVNEDRTRGALIRRHYLHPANHDDLYEADLAAFAHLAGGGVPDAD